MSGSNMRVSIEVTADNRQAVAAIAGVKQEVEKLAPAGAAAGQAAGAGIKQVGDAAGNAAPALVRMGSGLRDTEAAARGAGQAVAITGNQMRQLAPQINDIATQLALGQSPFMILAAQGGQITQVFGGVRNTLAALASFLGPAGIAGILGFTVGGSIILGLERDSRALNDLSQRLRATRSDAAGLAREVDQAAQNVSQSSGVGRSDAREAGRIIAGQRNFSGDRAEIEGLIRLSADLARVMGVDVTQAADQFVAKAIRDPAAAAREAAAGGLLGFNDALRRQVELLAASGQRGQAARLVLDQYRRSAGGAADELTTLERWWRAVANGANQAADAAERYATAMGRGVAAASNAVAPTLQIGRNAPNAPELPQEQWDFARRLSARESSNRPDALNARGYAGLYQFGAERLAQLRLYQPAEGENLAANNWIGRFQIPGFDGVRNIGDFRGNERAQDAALARHLADIDRTIASLPGAAGFNQDGLRAVAHLGGERGLRRFVSGTGDPADGNGTRLSTYYREFSGGDAPRGGSGEVYGPPMPASLEQRANALMRGRDTNVDRAAMLGEQEATLQGRLNQLDPNSTEAERYREALRGIRTELAAMDDPLTRATRQLGDQFERMGALTGAARDLANAEIQARNAARTEGLNEEQTQQRIATARAQAQAELADAFNQSMRTRDAEVESQRRQIVASRDGAAAVEREAIAFRARTEAMRTAPEGTPTFNTRVQQITASETERLSNPRISSVLVEQAQTRDRQELEQRLIGASATTRAQETAAFRERQRLGAGADTPEGQSAITGARALAANQVELERTQAAYNEFGRVGEQAVDRIGQAITSGTLSLKDMGRIGLSVASELTQAFFRLAVINPLKNLAGGNAPTLGDVGGVLSRLLGGGNAAAQSAAAAAQTQALPSVAQIATPGFFNFFHGGGIVGGTPTFTRPVNDNLFIGAPRFHDGGILAPDEVPAILQRGEGVFTAEQMAALGRGDHLGGSAAGGGNTINFHMPVSFAGDSGSKADQQALLGQMRAQMLSVIAEAMPDIARTSHQYTMGEISRGGNAARVVGRR